MKPDNSGRPGILQRSIDVREHELKATLCSFLFVFLLMAAYYVLRPLRDAMASDWSDAELSWLWTLNFFISTLFVAAYGVLVSKLRFKYLVPMVYLGFASSFLLFYLLVSRGPESSLVDKSFYVWVSVFALFHVSVFWSLMADTFNSRQAGRLFGSIGAGASLGAIAGPAFTALFADTLGLQSLLLLAALVLLLPIPLTGYLQYLKRSELGNASLVIDDEQKKIGGNPLEGFSDFIRNPYLLGIGLFIILYTGIGSFIYFEQKNLLVDYDRAARASIYGYRDLAVNILTFILAFFVTGRMVSRLGMPATLPLVPVIIVLGMLVLAFSPVLGVAIGLHIAARAGNYGLTRPAREMLFTEVDQASRFKTKPVIDIVAYRGGDVLMGWLFTGLTQGLGLGLAAVAGVGALIAALWAATGLMLGRVYEQKKSTRPAER